MVWRAFRRLDTSRTGTITIPEFRKILTLCHVQVSAEEMYHILCEVGVQLEGKVPYEIFLQKLVALAENDHEDY